MNVVQVNEVKPHPNADRLELVCIDGWEIISGKGNYSAGDTVVHVPPDAMVPMARAQGWGVDKYLSFRGQAEMGRVKAQKLRGVVSFGFLVPNDTQSEVGTDLREHYGIEKYEPPAPGMDAGRVRHCHPLFHRYTNIQNLRNHTRKLDYEQELIVTEKIHGTNSRVGWVRRLDPAEGESEFEKVVGTHNTQRKLEECGIYGLPFELYDDQLEHIFLEAQKYCPPGEQLNSLIIFGEIYGAGVQDLHYGKKEQKGYRVFDITLNGRYIPWKTMAALCDVYRVPTVEVLERGYFGFDDLKALAEGNTLHDDSHIREGIVVRPFDQELTWGRTERVNDRRMIFKLINPDYLLRKGGSEYH